MSIQQLKLSNILLIGDTCIDEYHYGTVDRLSQEAPVPILLGEEVVTKRGMAANVLDNLRAFGHNVTTIFPPSDTIRKIRYIDKQSSQHLLRVDIDNLSEPLNIHSIELPKNISAVVISDYCKGFLTYETIISLLRHYKNVPTFIDTKKVNTDMFCGAILKLNKSEAKKASSIGGATIITLGGEGAEYKDIIYPTKKVPVVDVCGAGDTFLAALVTGYMSTYDIPESIKLANKAASISVQHSGVYSLSAKDIEEICQ